MSHIAAALAKSKGKVAPAASPTELAPKMPAVHVPAPAPVASVTATAKSSPAKKIPLVPVLGGVAALVLAGAVAWFFLGTTDEISAAPTKPVPTTGPKPTAPAVAAVPKPAVEPAATLAVTPSAPVAAAPETDALAAQLRERVGRFSITARRVPEQRVMIDGKMYAAGARIGEDLTVQEVREDRVLFRDDRGQTYEK